MFKVIPFYLCLTEFVLILVSVHCRYDPQLVQLHNLIVTEGSQSSITTANIDVVFRYEDFGISDSSVLFKILDRPRNGQIFLIANDHHHHRESFEQRQQQLKSGDVVVEFTLNDLNHNRVLYVHDDSEESYDNIGMQMIFTADGKSANAETTEQILPGSYYRFMLHIQILPRNDQPELILPNQTLVMIANTTLKITTNILNVSDADDDFYNLIYYLHYLQGFHGGYFEMLDAISGVRSRVMQFTHANVLEGKIHYLNKGASFQQVHLQVSDGKDLSSSKVLNVEAVSLQIRVAVNRVLMLAEGSAVAITSENLLSKTNAVLQEIELRYEITKYSNSGRIQRQHYADNLWMNVSTFTQEHINGNRLRYAHVAGEPDRGRMRDSFHFKVSALGMKLEESKFSIRLMENRIRLVQNSVLRLNGISEGILTSDLLKAESTIPQHKPNDLIYRLTISPRKGHLISIGQSQNTTDNNQRKRIFIGQNFSQEDVNESRIFYKLLKTNFVSVTDEFEFQLSIPGFELEAAIFKILFEPSTNGLQLINTGLMNVKEGERKSITSENLFTYGPIVSNFMYNVIEGPYHGLLQFVQFGTGFIEATNVIVFTNDDILNKRVQYYHDNSETEVDYFRFNSTSADLDHQSEQTSGIFDISIVLLNDNAPRRQVNKIFKVLRNRGRVITRNDVWFIDPDLDYDSSLLEYEWLDVTNGGEIVLASNHKIPVKKCTQKEIANRRLYFRHRGTNLDQSVCHVRVTDGYFSVIDQLQIEVSEPFLRIPNESFLIIAADDNKIIQLLPNFFNIETNIEADDDDVKFVVVTTTSFGILKKNEQVTHWFSLADLKNQVVWYEHNLFDEFKYLLKIDDYDVHAPGVIKMASYVKKEGDSLKFHSSSRINVEELHHVTITHNLLYVNHSSFLSSDVQYIITSHPSNGKLWLTGQKADENLLRFTQDDINTERLRYEHQSEGHHTDVFQFDVQLNLTFLVGLKLYFDIIPYRIPVRVQNLTVKEGSVVYITQNTLNVASKFFDEESLEFQIVVEPRHGRIQNSESHGIKTAKFSMQQIIRQKILFVSDGSDSLTDEFQVLAELKAQNKWSYAVTVHIRILPVNDQPPKLIVNKKLTLFAGGFVLPISRDHLYVEDNDTRPDDIVYLIQFNSSVNGYVAIIKSQQMIDNFTQTDVDQLRIVFLMRDGETRGYFEFKTTDGVSFTQKMVFEIELVSLVMLLEVNQPLELFPGHTHPITSSHLKTSINNKNFEYQQSIVYSVERKPEKGKLIKYDDKSEVTTFTQKDIDANQVLYKHLTPSKMNSWMQNDSFIFGINTANAEALDSVQIFFISISYKNIDLNDTQWRLKCEKTSVDEGSSVKITKLNLDLSEFEDQLRGSGLENLSTRLVVRETPKHGQLKIRDDAVRSEYRISQKDIDEGHVVYSHDDSESVLDQVSFVIEISAKLKMLQEQEEEAIYDWWSPTNYLKVFYIVIHPVNDQRFTLLTPSPAIEIIQGLKYNTINQSILYTTDPDTSSTGIVYEIDIPPSNGHLVISHNDDYQQISSFRQKDVDDERVLFIHDGGSGSGAFYFKVSDGKHKPLYKIFNIHVLPLTLDVVSFSPIEILQGFNTTRVSLVNFNVKTNGRKNHLMYNITQPPSYGNLHLYGFHQTDRFSQEDVENGSVSYVQNDLTTSIDDFQFLLYDIQNVIRGHMNIIVLPNLRKTNEPFPAVVGKSSKITIEHLDASFLSIITGSDPVYYVTVAPNHGFLTKNSTSALRLRRDVKLRKVKGKYGKGGETDHRNYYVNDAVFVFSHSDVLQEIIEYEMLESNNSESVSKDGFRYVLTADNVQPAEGTFDIKIYQTEASMYTDLGLLITNKMNSRTNSNASLIMVDQETAKRQTDFYIKRIIPVIVAFVILLIVIVVIIKTRCRSTKKNKENKEHDQVVRRIKPNTDQTDAPNPAGRLSFHRADSIDNLETNTPLLKRGQNSIPQRNGQIEPGAHFRGDSGKVTPNSRRSLPPLTPVPSPDQKLLLYFEEKMTTV